MKERWTARWLRKRALLYHLLVLILAPGCLYAGWWQIHRAESGNTLSYLYAVEWPIFAVLSVIGWWQLIHEDPAAVEARKVERARRAAHQGPYIPPPPEADSGFYHGLGTGTRGSLGAGDGAGGNLVRRGSEDGTGLTDLVAADTTLEGEPVATHALSSYNAYLAQLAAAGGRKSWRNPHGLAPTRRRPRPSAPLDDRDGPPALDGGFPAEVGPGPDPTRRASGPE